MMEGINMEKKKGGGMEEFAGDKLIWGREAV